VLGEALIEHGKIRRNDVRCGQVFGDEFAQKRARLGEQALDLRAERRGLVEFVLLREVEQRVVWR
jgi:hypothetical protein